MSELESDDHEVINAAIEDYVAEPEESHVYPLGGDIRKSIDRYVNYVNSRLLVARNKRVATLLSLKLGALKVILLKVLLMH